MLFIVIFILLFVSAQSTLLVQKFQTINLGTATSPLQLTYTDLTKHSGGRLTITVIANFTIIVPPNLAAQSITITLYGAPGQKGRDGCPGGNGESVAVTFQPKKVFKKTQTFYILINNDGGFSTSVSSNGGSSVDMRYPGSTLDDRILVAPGGGGGGLSAIDTQAPGGNAGGNPATGNGDGQKSDCKIDCTNGGGGATATSGGAVGCQGCGGGDKCTTHKATAGTFELGGQGGASTDQGGGGGGGGGWYGGGGGVDCGGGGGSSYISTKLSSKLTTAPTWNTNTVWQTNGSPKSNAFSIGWAEISWTGAQIVSTAPTGEPSPSPSLPPSIKPSYLPSMSTTSPSMMPTSVVNTFTYNDKTHQYSYTYAIPAGAVTVSLTMVGASGGLAYANQSLSSVAQGGLAGVVQGEIDLSSFPTPPNNQPVSLLMYIGSTPPQHYCQYQSSQLFGCVYSTGVYAGNTYGGGGGGISGGAGGGGASQIQMTYNGMSYPYVNIATAPGGGGGGINGLGYPCPGGNGQSDSSGVGSSSPICPVPSTSGVNNTCPSTGGTQTNGGSCINSCWAIYAGKNLACNAWGPPTGLHAGFGGGATQGSGGTKASQYGSGGGGGYFGGAGGTSVYNPYLKQYFGGPGAGGSSYVNPTYVSNVQYSAASGPGNGWIQLVSNYPTNTATGTVVVSGSVPTTGRKLRNGDGNKEQSHQEQVPDQLVDLLKKWMSEFLRGHGKFNKFVVTLKKSKSKSKKNSKSSNKVNLQIGTLDAKLLQQIKEFVGDTRNDAIGKDLFQKHLDSSDLKGQGLSIENFKLH